VNGDDTVISAARAVSADEYPSGFRLNDTKTIRASNVVEVNSTVFLRRGGKWREVRHLRRGGATSTYQGMMHMAKAVSSRPCWVDAFVRSRIGRSWGILPSQVGHRTYPSFLRERVMRHRRIYTELPVQPGTPDVRLRCIHGRDASAAEAEALRGFLWENGRGGGLKRDVWTPTQGAIRRTYQYRDERSWSSLSFVAWAGHGQGPRVKDRVFFLPEEADTDEEKVGLLMLEIWNQSVFPLAQE